MKGWKEKEKYMITGIGAIRGIKISGIGNLRGININSGVHSSGCNGQAFL